MKEQSKKVLVIATRLLFYIYIILLSYFLFFSEHYGRVGMMEDYRYNLELFKEIKRFIEYRQQLGMESVVVNILGNILAFAPFGFLLPMINTRFRNFFRLFFGCFLFTLTVELLQLVLRVGIFDVDDILLNTLGGVIGFIAHAIGSAFYRKRQVRNRNGRRRL